MDDLIHPKTTAETALRKFEELTGFACRLLQWEPVETGNTHRIPDAQVEVRIGQRYLVFAAEVKRHIDRVGMLHQVKNQLQAFGRPGLLITNHLTQKLAQQCRELDLPFMDTAGNAYLKDHETFILVTGQRPAAGVEKAEKAFRAFDRTGLKVLYAFICQPEFLNAPYRDIAKAAGVALGTVGWIFTDLRDHGFLVDPEKGARRLLDRERLYQGWIGNYPTRLRNKLATRRFTAQDPEWWKEAQPREYGAYWGGEVAAAKLTKYLIPKTCTLYTLEDPKHLIIRHRLRPDPMGTIEILDAFWEHALPQAGDQYPDVVHPLLIEADLMAVGDPRTIETAKMIHEQHLA